jgi:hypothetical protein
MIIPRYILVEMSRLEKVSELDDVGWSAAMGVTY